MLHPAPMDKLCAHWTDRDGGHPDGGGLLSPRVRDAVGRLEMAGKAASAFVPNRSGRTID